jgi:hypothetical protein
MPRRLAVMVTGMRRLRPVVMTAITTMLGLLPTVTGFGFDFRAFRFVAGGESSQWWRPMGVAVIFGLASATFLTLVLVPVLYDALLGFREREGRWWGRIKIDLERRRRLRRGETVEDLDAGPYDGVAEGAARTPEREPEAISDPATFR